MTVANKGFETAGQKPGVPEGWVLSSGVTSEELAGYPQPGGNLLLYSEQLDNAVWSLTAGAISADADTPPSGVAGVDATASIADRITENVGGGAKAVNQTIIPSHPVVTAKVNCSFYAKAQAQSLAFLQVLGVDGTSTAWFDLSAGTIGPSTTSPIADFAAAIEDVGGGWYRCSISVSHTLGADGNNLAFVMGATDTEGATSYTGTGVDAITLFGAQVAWGEALPTYVTTTATADLVELGYESFETLWGRNDAFEFVGDATFDLMSVTRAPAETLPKFAEDYEEGWSTNEDYLFALGNTEAASFDAATPAAYEDFEEEWGSNEDYLFSWADVLAGPGATAAAFDDMQGATNAMEDFEQGWGLVPEHFAAPNHLADLFNHSTPTPDTIMQPDEPIEFYQQGGQTLPAGLSFAPSRYYVEASTTTAFTISLTAGGPQFTFTDDGAGGPFVFKRVGGNLTQLSTFIDGAHNFASFDAGTPEAFEDFEEEWPSVVMSTV